MEIEGRYQQQKGVYDKVRIMYIFGMLCRTLAPVTRNSLSCSSICFLGVLEFIGLRVFFLFRSRSCCCICVRNILMFAKRKACPREGAVINQPARTGPSINVFFYRLQNSVSESVCCQKKASVVDICADYASRMYVRRRMVKQGRAYKNMKKRHVQPSFVAYNSEDDALVILLFRPAELYNIVP